MPIQTEVPTETEVLIIGAGPVGLALALELGQQGQACLLVECQSRAGLAPRAKTTNVRTRELLRRWGIAGHLADASPFGVDYPSNVVFATRMDGHELTRFENAFYCAPERDDRFSEHAQWIPQYKVEQVLREHALACGGVALREGLRLCALRQDQDRVEATLEDVASGQRSTVRARYLVGADGARSTVRDQLGIKMAGVSPLSMHRNHVFRAPRLASQHHFGPAVMYWLINPDMPSVLAPLDDGDLWTFGHARPADADNDAPPEALITRALGFATDIEVLGSDDWTAHQLVADRYRDRRVFLAGDACHLHPPFGGHGMNMGIGDAVDLGWKLAAVLSGWGGPALLDSYEIERRQVHQRVIGESVLNHSYRSEALLRPDLEQAGPAGDQARADVATLIQTVKQPEFDSLGVVLGAHYETSPVLAREPQDSAPWVPGPRYEAHARPGCRAPHVWLDAGRAHGASLFDHFASGSLTLLSTRPYAHRHAQPVLDAAHATGLPLKHLPLDTAELRDRYGADLVLVRPDHHVAWRGNSATAAIAALAVARGAA
ncbi:FAD-dependent monooxygenase [Hydrogenophaga sp. OTU3427]|uniref:FAD-dependent monooxygenase n=1 Tax=Hydrogenophaga sp. OTU3427 TaxID=3043856 RepID=UPI00313E9F75